MLQLSELPLCGFSLRIVSQYLSPKIFANFHWPNISELGDGIDCKGDSCDADGGCEGDGDGDVLLAMVMVRVVKLEKYIGKLCNLLFVFLFQQRNLFFNFGSHSLVL